MNCYDFYITPEEYIIAEKNGVCKITLEERIRYLGWDKQRAIYTKPLIFNKLDKHWVEIAKENGICYSTFKYRVNILGWSVEVAATKKLQNKKEQAKKAHEASRKYPKEFLELAIKNGISIRTFHTRVKNNWSLEDAANKPIMTPTEIGKMTKDKRQIVFDIIFNKNNKKGVRA